MVDLEGYAREELARFVAEANVRLQHHFKRWRNDVPPAKRRPTPLDLFEAVVELTLRSGKRLRPALAYHAALCFDGETSRESLLDAALSLELLQSALLIHDDIMDHDELRRGGPTVHITMTEMMSDAHLGASVAMLAGSLACALSQRLLTEANFPPARLTTASYELARIQEAVLYGQHLDLVGGAPASTLQDLKTTSYTTRGPVRFGAILVDAPEDQIQVLVDYATPLGRAFQTRDDLLGTFGDPNKLGKPVGADLREGKRTELIQIALERADAEGQRALEAVLGRPNASAAEIAHACDVIEETGSRAELERLIDTQTQEAIAALDGANFRPEGADFLKGIAMILARRLR